MVRKVKPAIDWHGEEDNNYTPEGSCALDAEEIYKILGLKDGIELRADEPLFEICRALVKYTHEAYPVHMPIFAERIALIKDVSEKATALAAAFDAVGTESYYDIEWGVEHGLGLEPSADDPSEGYVDAEIAFFRECSTDYVRRIARQMKAAVEAFPRHPDAPSSGRPAKTALVSLIQELAWIYERQIGQDAYRGFASDPETNEYDSSFFQFVWAVVSKYDPSAAKTNNALGMQIRKAMTGPTIEDKTIQVFYEGDDHDFTDGKE